MHAIWGRVCLAWPRRILDVVQLGLQVYLHLIWVVTKFCGFPEDDIQLFFCDDAVTDDGVDESLDFGFHRVYAVPFWLSWMIEVRG